MKSEEKLIENDSRDCKAHSADVNTEHVDKAPCMSQSVGSLSSLAVSRTSSDESSVSEPSKVTSTSTLTLSVANTSHCHPVSLSIIEPDLGEENYVTTGRKKRRSGHGVHGKMRTSSLLTAKKRSVTLAPARAQIATRQQQLEQTMKKRPNDEDKKAIVEDDKASMSGASSVADAAITAGI